MDESTEALREQIEETKSQLSEKLETLEQQVSDSVVATGAAVSATVESVHQTVETVSSAVESAIHSLSNACDLRRQIDRHPLLVLGGSAVVGFMIGRALNSASRTDSGGIEVPCATNGAPPMVDGTTLSEAPAAISSPATVSIGVPTPDSTATVAAITSAYESGMNRSAWNQIQGAAIAALTGLVQAAASHAVPRVMDLLIGELTGASRRFGKSIPPADLPS